MGMSASQARLLELTARKSNIEYEGQQINQQRMQLAQRTSDISKAYSEGIANRRIYLFDKGGNSTVRATFQNLTGEDTTAGNTYNYRFVDKSGRIVTDTTDTFNGKNIDPSNYVVMPDVDKPEMFEKWLRDGDITMQKQTTDLTGNTTWSNTEWETETSITDKLYTDDDAAVQAEYDAKSATVQQQDKELELRLKQLDSEEKAISEELDAVKKVIENNVKASFKTFA